MLRRKGARIKYFAGGRNRVSEEASKEIARKVGGKHDERLLEKLNKKWDVVRSKPKGLFVISSADSNLQPQIWSPPSTWILVSAGQLLWQKLLFWAASLLGTRDMEEGFVYRRAWEHFWGVIELLWLHYCMHLLIHRNKKGEYYWFKILAN